MTKNNPKPTEKQLVSPTPESVGLTGEGLDILAAMILRGEIRTGMLNGVPVVSVVDLVAQLIGDQTRDPSKWWNENKARIIGKTEQLSANIGKLRLKARDGKMRPTDMVEFWLCPWIIARMDTPKANVFSESYYKHHANEDIALLRRRAYQIVVNRSEWAADSIHQELLDAGLTHSDPDDDVWGKDRWGNR